MTEPPNSYNVHNIHGVKLGNSLASTPPQATIDAMNQLWFSFYSLKSAGGDASLPLNLNAIAQAIAGVVGLSPSIYDTPTINIMNALSGGQAPPAAGSPAALAAAYLADPTNPTAEKEFAESVNSGLAGININGWWGAEGMSSNGATNSPGTLTQGDVQTLYNALNTYLYDSNPTDAELQAVVAAINKVKADMPSTGLDPYSKMLNDILTTPIDPELLGSTVTLESLAAEKSDSQLGFALNRYGFALGLPGQIQTIINKEFLHQ